MADQLNGRKTASGVPYDARDLVAAHRTFPLGTIVRVTNEENGRAVDLKIIDRTGPGAGTTLDVSRAAAEKLGFVEQGRTRIRIDVLQWGPRSSP